MNKKSKHVVLAMCIILAALPFIVTQKAIPATTLASCSKTITGDKDILLVNYNHKIPLFYNPDLMDLDNGEKIDKSIYPDLQKMFNDARVLGLNPKVNSGYRDKDSQRQIMQDFIEDYIKQGMSEDEAKEEAEKWVAQPGCSEHETGLAVDIGPSKGCISSRALYTWLKANSYKYGFILRYPPNKKDITRVEGEHWHFRYVGYEAAKEMHQTGQCLEEYLGEA